MMTADTFKLTGRVTVTPPITDVDYSGDYTIGAELLEQLALSKSIATLVTLDADPAETLNMADITTAHVVVIKTTGPVTVRITTSAGAAQAFIVNKLLILTCDANPVTAITLQRAAGITTTCRCILGQV